MNNFITEPTLLRKLRVGQGLSLKEASSIFGICGSTLSQIERGLRPFPIEKAEIVAANLGIEKNLLLVRLGIITEEMIHRISFNAEAFLLAFNNDFARYSNE